MAENITVRLSDELALKLAEEHEKTRLTKPEIIRLALEKHLFQEPPKQISVGTIWTK